MKLYQWKDTTSDEIQTCNHRWTGFVKCVSHEPLDKFQCIECGKITNVKDGYCMSGELFVKVDDFDTYTNVEHYLDNTLSDNDIKYLGMYMLDAMNKKILEIHGETTAYRFRRKTIKILGFNMFGLGN